MTQHQEPSFDRVADQFLESYSKQVNGYIRYEVIHANLLRTLAGLSRVWRKDPKRIVDIGAGDGRDARWLASFGHRVVAVDPSPTMVETARTHDEPELEAIVEGNARVALETYGEGAFDGVLSHGVLPYMEDPKNHLEELSDLVHDGGFVSLLSKGFYGTLLRYANERQFPEMRDYIKTGRYVVNRLGEDATAYGPEQTEIFLRRAGFSDILNWFGVTIITDSVEDRVEDFDKDNLELLLGQELDLSRDSSTRGMGQLLHFVARKT